MIETLGKHAVFVNILVSVTHTQRHTRKKQLSDNIQVTN